KLLKLKVIADIDDLDIYQTVDEGIENRIRKFIYKSKSLDELILNIKTKRYTYNKIRRMLTHILCSFKKSDAKNLEIEYLRVLGFNSKGHKVLNSIKKEIDIPIYFNYKEKLNKYLDLDFKVATIYSEIVDDPRIIEDEFKIFPIKK
ncbi:MAG: nucleotidyltransferase family protein, partial [Bacilli bacterium]|nr:nucleotidyltransferase family protein [Bacilli bacterium]